MIERKSYATVITNDPLPQPRGDGSDGTDDIDRIRILTIRSGLYLETRGIQAVRGRSMYARVKQEFGLRGTKQRVFEEFCRMHNLSPDMDKGSAHRG